MVITPSPMAVHLQSLIRELVLARYPGVCEVTPLPSGSQWTVQVFSDAILVNSATAATLDEAHEELYRDVVLDLQAENTDIHRLIQESLETTERISTALRNQGFQAVLA